MKAVSCVPTKNLPKFLSKEFKLHHTKLNNYAKERRLSMMDIANKYVQENDYISKVIIGVASYKQMSEIVQSWRQMMDGEPIEGNWRWGTQTDIDPRCW